MSAAEREAERIAELEAEVEHLRAQVPPCDGGCSYGDGPQEDCSAHGRRPTDLWSLLHEEHERAEAAEAKLAAVRDLHLPMELIHADAPAFPHRTLVCTECGTDKGPWAVWPCATIQAIEGDVR